MMNFEVKVIGRVVSQLTDLESAPRQPDEGAPEAWLVFEPEMLEGLRSLRFRRVFSTRSPHCPNPIGLHQVEITAIEDGRVRVRNLEALHGTPIIDVKAILRADIRQR